MNTPTPRPDVEGIAAELRETCNCNIDTSPCGAEDACRVAYRAADYIEALEERQAKLETVVAKETLVIRNFMARINPTKLAAADDQQYVVAINAIDNLEALEPSDG